MKQSTGKRMVIGFSFVTVLVAAMALGLVGTVFGVPGYLNGTGSFNAQYGTTYTCALCHGTASGSPNSPRNPFGADWASSSIGNHLIPMTTALANRDSDGDGIPNSAEIAAGTYPGVPTVTINQAAGQADPTNASPINFTVVFSHTMTGFATGDVTIGGTAGGTKTATVTGSGTTYNVAVTGMTSAGTVTASIAAGVAQNAAGFSNTASTSADNTVTYTLADTTPPSVTINQAAAQADPTSSSPINFTVVFSEAVTGFTASEVTISGTAGGTKTVTLSGTGPTYNVAVSGMTSAGTVIASIAAGVAQDGAGNLNTASTSTDNTVTYTLSDTTPPSVTINQAAAQADPTSSSPINFTVVFSEVVTGFATGDVAIGGTAGGTKTATVTGSGTTYNVAVSGMTSAGTVIASIAAGVAQDAAGNLNTASTSTDNTVTYDATAPTVTINQAAGQADPTSSSPINFTVVFSESVTGFASGDVTISGTAGGTKTVTLSGTGPTYTVSVSGMTTSGTVIATIAASVAQDAAGNLNTASTSTDNTVTYNAADTTPPSVTINQASGQADPTSSSPINFTVVFSEAVTGFATGDVTIGGTAGGTKTATVTGSGTTYNVAVSGMTSAGTVIVSIAASVAQDAAGNLNTASTSTDNTVTYTPPPPSGDCPTTFSNPTRITNRYLPLSSLVQDILEGDMGGVTEHVERTMLQGTKTFTCGDQEVETLIMEDRAFVDGVLEEVALDYFAQGDDGTVYYFGEEVQHFDEAGNMIGTEGSWLFGVDTTQLGVIMPGRPRVRMTFQAENVPGITTENDKVLSLSKTVRVPAGRFRNCVQIQENLSDGTTEYKYYAPGVGVVKESTPDGDLNLISHNASDHGGGERD